MPDQESSYFGKKFACPGCQSSLKFRRPPKSLLQTCPNCRRKLRLKERDTLANDDDLLKEAIETLVDWKEPQKQEYNYRRDPALDEVDNTEPGVWIFSQPWPEEFHQEQVVLERVEVAYNPLDIIGTIKSRQLLFDGKFRRVTVFRTGQVEEIEVTGHWWDLELKEGKLGILSRAVVRELNKNPSAKQFSARINCIQQLTSDDQKPLELFIDLAIDKSIKKTRSGIRYR